MVRLIAIAFALALATSAQATPLAPLHKDGMITQVREACGAGYHMVNGTCIRTAAPPERRQVCGWNAYSRRPLRSLNAGYHQDLRLIDWRYFANSASLSSN